MTVARAPSVDGVLIARALRDLSYRALGRLDAGYKPTEEEKAIAGYAVFELGLDGDHGPDREQIAERAIREWHDRHGTAG